MYVALVGNVSDGYKCVGPFKTFEDAARALDNVESWIMELDGSYDGTVRNPPILVLDDDERKLAFMAVELWLDRNHSPGQEPDGMNDLREKLL